MLRTKTSGRNVKTLVKAGCAAALVAAMALPSLVSAQGYAYDSRYSQYHGYDGYCYEKKHDAQADGVIIGALAGGAIGGAVSNTHSKGVGTVLGALVGAAVGSNVGRHSVTCYGGNYYAYQGAYYDPAPPPAGYVTVFFHDRPDGHHFHDVWYDRANRAPPRPDHGWRDAQGGWHNDHPPHDAWRDEHGYWHGH